MHGTFLVIFQIFHDFQSLWEPWLCQDLYIDADFVLLTKGTEETVKMAFLQLHFLVLVTNPSAAVWT